MNRKAPEDDSPMDEESFAFGSFRLIPAQRMLLEDGKPLRLGSRALQLLIALVEHAGETIQKDQLIARVWPDTVVDEGALRVHVAALRKALGDGRAGNRYIVNDPGRGYTFVAPVAREQRQPATAPPDGATVGGNLPMPLTRIVGRDGIIAALTAQLAQRRFLTIVGPGGIGKTTVAIAVAETVRASYRDGVWFVGLASLPDPDLVPSALSTALGISLPGANPISGLAGWLRDKRALIVLDSCEHVIGAVASIAEAILKAAARVSILATSREPLRAEGEWLHRLTSLELPPRSDDLTPDGALQYSAVQLFNERALAIIDGFALGDEDVAPVFEICHRLDGMPLALELAAARVDVFGVKGLAARLDDRFAVLTSGRRTALPRHQTLRAAMDWSYEVLPEAEQVILRRLAVFRGDFTMDTAAAVATDERITTADVFEGVANLAAKSLVATDVSGHITYHRLLDTTRTYALEKLSESGELKRLERRHAEHFRDLFQCAESEWEMRPNSAWLAAYGGQVDNMRTALDWAFSSGGDAALGVALTVTAVPLWFQLSLIDECRNRVERALTFLGEPKQGSRQKMKLFAALGWSLMYTTGPARESGAAWATALELADELDDTDYKLRTIWGLWAGSQNNGEFRAALALAEKFCNLAAGSANSSDRPTGDRMMGAVLHFLGEQADARRHIERMLGQYATPDRRLDIVRFQFDQQVTARITLGRILWLQGFADQAMREVESNIEDASSINHTLSLCNALAQAACPIALMVGDFPAAERFSSMLLRHTQTSALNVWHAYGDCFRGQLLIKRGHFDAGLRLCHSGVAELRKARFVQYFTAFLGTLAEGLAEAGQVSQGLAAVDEALARCERYEERWGMPELLRIKGEILAKQDPADPAASENHLLCSLDWARRQGGLSWELRTASSLARLWRDQHRVTEARELLESAYGRFTEGFATADLREARSLLEQLA
jgi:predicted ATPase/DNA-binding winged helix-turn-helix (wHTH) protein